MPVTWTVEPGGRYIVLSTVNPHTFAEWKAAMLEIFATAKAGQQLRILTDRRTCEPLTTAFVGQKTDFFTTHQSAFVGGREAILVADDTGFGMGRMTELRAALDNPHFTIQVFRNYHAAVSWLTGSAHP